MTALDSTVELAREKASALSVHAHPTEHFVQFYRDEQVLIDSLARYVRQAIAEGAAAVAIATRAHTEALECRLRAEGIDVAAVRGSERLILLDAEQTLATFMVDGTPNRERFFARVGRIVATAAHRHLRTARLVAVTGYGQADDRQRTQAAGFDEHLVKPVELSALARTLAAITAPAEN